MAENQVEKLILQDGASRFRNFRATGGMLSLTTDKIIFRSRFRSGEEGDVEIELRSISAVNSFCSMNVNPNGISIVKTNGETENFVVDDRRKWRDYISNCLKSLEQ